MPHRTVLWFISQYRTYVNYFAKQKGEEEGEGRERGRKRVRFREKGAPKKGGGGRTNTADQDSRGRRSDEVGRVWT